MCGSLLNKKCGSVRNGEKFPLGSGVPCRVHDCVACCIETEMPLTDEDITRIIEHGYSFLDFVVKRENEFYLRNRSDKCFFLEASGCGIYSYRPEGCRLYPLVYNEGLEEAVFDDFCPFNDWFEVCASDVKRLRDLVNKLSDTL